MRNKFILMIAIIIVLSNFSLPNRNAFALTTDWPIVHGNNLMTGTTDSGPQGNNIKQLWQYSVAPPIMASPIIADGKLYFSSCSIFAKDETYNKSSLTCLDAETGERVWENKLNGWGMPFGSPVYDKGNLFIGTFCHVRERDEKQFKDQYMYCLDAKTGKEKWSFGTEGPVVTAAIPYNGSVFFGAATYKGTFELFKLEIATGRRLWSQILPNIIGSDAITAYADMIYFTCQDGMVYAIEEGKGKIDWKTKITSTRYLLSCVVADERSLYVGSYDDSLYCLDRKNGDVKWKYEVNLPIMSTPALSGNNIVFVTFDEEKAKEGQKGRSKIHCVTTEGKKVWEIEAEVGSQASPSISNGKVYLFYGWDSFSVLNLKDGSIIYNEKIKTVCTNSPAIADGKVIFGDWDGVLRCYGDSVLEPNEIDFAEIEPGSNERLEAKLTNSSEAEMTFRISEVKGGWFSVDRTEIKVRPKGEATLTFSLIPEKCKAGEILKGDFILSFATRKIKIYASATVRNTSTNQNCNGWSMYGANASHNHNLPAQCGPKSSALLSKWNIKLEKDSINMTSMCTADDKLYVCESEVSKGTVTSYSQNSGRKIWTTKIEGVSDTSVATNGKMVYVGYYGGLKCLDSNSGLERWNFNTKYSKDGLVMFHPKPILVGNKVIFGAADSHCYALDSDTGRRIWDFKLSGSVMMSPAASGKMVFVGALSSSILHGLDIVTGKSKWSATLEGNLDAYPSYSNDMVYISTALGAFKDDSTKGKVYCLSARTGETIWSKETKARVNSSITITSDTVFFGSKDGKVYACDAQTGDDRWNASTSGKILSSPVYCKEMLFVTSMDGNLYLLNSYDGATISKFNLGAECLHTPVVSNGLVFTLNSDRQLNCLAEDPDSEPVSIKVYYPTSNIELGQKVQLQTEMTDKKGEKIMGFRLSWEVEPSEIGKVDQFGVFEALSIGHCKVTASYSNISGSMEFDVVEKIPPTFEKTIDFGTVSENEEKEVQIRFKNLSFKPTKLTLKTDADWFKVVGSTSLEIEPSSTKTVSLALVTANVTAGAKKESKLTVEWPGGNDTITVKVTCKGLQFSRESIDFGEVQGGTFPERTIVISNTSSLKFTVKCSSKDGWLIVDPKSQEIEPRNEGIFKIKIDTTVAQAQKPIEGNIVFDWGSGALNMPVKAYVIGDKIPPVLKVNDVPEQMNAETISVTGTTEKGAIVTVNGKPAILTGDQFKADVKLSPAPSKTSITIVATDKSGNKTEVKKEVVNVFKTIVIMKIGDGKMYVFGMEKPVNPPPMVIKGSTFVPLRSVGDAFGANIEYNAAKKEITITLWEKIIVLTIGSDKAVINGNQANVKPPPQIVGGKTMVPLRFIAEAFGAGVSFEASSKTITITLEKRP